MIDTVQLRDQLRQLGYAARIANGDCFDIDQDGYTHYLCLIEAEALARAGAGVDLMNHAERRGLNYWYDFGRAEQREDGER